MSKRLNQWPNVRTIPWWSWDLIPVSVAPKPVFFFPMLLISVPVNKDTVVSPEEMNLTFPLPQKWWVLFGINRIQWPEVTDLFHDTKNCEIASALHLLGESSVSLYMTADIQLQSDVPSMQMYADIPTSYVSDGDAHWAPSGRTSLELAPWTLS